MHLPIPLSRIRAFDIHEESVLIRISKLSNFLSGKVFRLIFIFLWGDPLAICGRNVLHIGSLLVLEPSTMIREEPIQVPKGLSIVAFWEMCLIDKALK